MEQLKSMLDAEGDKVLSRKRLTALLGGDGLYADSVLQAMKLPLDDTAEVLAKDLSNWIFEETTPEADPTSERANTQRMQKLLQLSDGDVASSAQEAMAEFEELALKMAKDFKARAEAPEKKEESFTTAVEELCVRRILEGCLFVGHVKTDLDSVAGAIGAAHLWNGSPARAELELNGEIMYALEFAGIEMPPFFDEMPGGKDPDAAGNLMRVCLVDHNEEKQMVEALRKDPNRKKRIVGIIDHHAIADNFSSEKPVYMDVRPWGSMSTIVAHTYMTSDRPMPKHIARILLCAIISDTLNLRSVTTTSADRMLVTLLSVLGEVDDVDELASRMFKAKTQWIVNLGAYEMVRGDQKDFESHGHKFGIAVLEVTDPQPVLNVASDILLELRILKVEKGRNPDGSENPSKELGFAFVFVVDVTNQQSLLLLCGKKELELAKVAFPGRPLREAGPNMKVSGLYIQKSESLMDIGSMVSRKAEFLPAFFKAFGDGFQPPKEEKEEDQSRKAKMRASVLNMNFTSFANNDAMTRDYNDFRAALTEGVEGDEEEDEEDEDT